MVHLSAKKPVVFQFIGLLLQIILPTKLPKSCWTSSVFTVPHLILALFKVSPFHIPMYEPVFMIFSGFCMHYNRESRFKVQHHRYHCGWLEKGISPPPHFLGQKDGRLDILSLLRVVDAVLKTNTSQVRKIHTYIVTCMKAT